MPPLPATMTPRSRSGASLRPASISARGSAGVGEGDLHHRQARGGEEDAQRDPDAVVPAALRFQFGAEERGDLAGQLGVAGGVVAHPV
jgi:hypothetical protein